MTRARHVVTALVLLGTLGACAKKGTSTGDTSTTSTNSPVVLQVQEAVCSDLRVAVASDAVSEAEQAALAEAGCG